MSELLYILSTTGATLLFLGFLFFWNYCRQPIYFMEALSLFLVPASSLGLPVFGKISMALFLVQFISTVLLGGLLKLLDDRLQARL